MPEQPKAWLKCPACGRLMTLDPNGRFDAHTEGGNKRWCEVSGKPAVQDERKKVRR